MTELILPPPLIEDAARRRAFLAGWAAIAVFIVLQTTANAFSDLSDFPRLDPREPFIWEYTSGAVVIALVPALGWLLRLAPPGAGRWARFALVHLTGSVGFSFAHVGSFVLLRKGLYALAGAHYGGADWLYEYRKDLVAYFGFVLILALADWAARLWAASRAPAEGSRLYHLRDGARVVRVPMTEIVAVTSARNYVEFHLAGGRKPLVRETLAKVEADLAGAGFLRTHRSWLVNPAHVRSVTPAAAGDFRLELDGGLSVPLSRRFPAALERLRTPDQPLVPLS
ncbi:LytTR family DNA-binding domain-containing protein [Phenylobacterium sp.]|uniref:LytTR family DNA-binding domain-containing protein n=1 Tax=Phenylobacterium sp. TaxID=1871053 RepID=UPI002DF1A316|nr:LytTR family DNA-binding domain-containing protein [Phenylobacterium sp.]